MKNLKKFIVLSLACFMLLGTVAGPSIQATPRLSTRYCPTHNKALVYKGQTTTTVCASCKKACTILYYTCPRYETDCYYTAFRCNQCGADW